jgi:hypothetical protein
VAFEITQGRLKQFKRQIGGVKSAYIASYVPFSRSQIVYDGVSLFSFPQTFIYKFDLISGESFQQNMNDSDGGKYYDISITLNFFKISSFDNLQFQKMLRRDWYIVIQDNNNNYFLLGFRNGMTCEKLDSNTSHKYSLTFTGQEEDAAPFCDELINNDFIIVDFYNKVFQNNDNFIFQNGDNYIFQ